MSQVFKPGDVVTLRPGTTTNMRYPSSLIGKYYTVVCAKIAADGAPFCMLRYDLEDGSSIAVDAFCADLQLAQSTLTNPISIEEAELTKKRFNQSEDNKGLTESMGKMLAQVVMPIDDKKAILTALVQEKADKRLKLFTEWGFDEILEKGKGLTFLFYGAPGTGKTMCAEAIAEHLGKKWLVLGAAEIESPIPGQAERNIKDAFKKAVTNKLVIIFDECDSLLYNRNHVGAILGAQINCLLSEIEKFDGVCILTTNRSGLLDPALERRVALKIEFKHPNEKARQYIWRKLVPAKCPLDKTVDLASLAKYDLTGGNIKNVILSAARTAIYADADKLHMTHFEWAIKKEVEGQTAFKPNKAYEKKQLMNFVDQVFTRNGNGQYDKVKGEL